MAAPWGVTVTDTLIHQPVQRAEQQAETRRTTSADIPAPPTRPPTAARAWVEPLLHQLRHGGEAQVLQTLHDLPAWCAARAQPLPPSVPTETQYFENHREHLHYEARAAEGCPMGSGAMESFCAQLQGRFKRCGQFWTEPGRRHRMARDIARRNRDWHQIWQRN